MYGILKLLEVDVPVPRLTNRDYLADREFLVEAWKLFRGIFTAVSYNQQLELHAFYQPSRNLTAEEALVHRAKITRERPNLPQKAGKHFKKVYQAASALSDRLDQEPALDLMQPVKVPAGGRRHIRVVPLARPEPDLKILANLLLDLAEQELRDEEAS